MTDIAIDRPLYATNGSVVGNKVEAPTKKELDSDFDTFLKLLTVQLQNQDPLNPMDGTEFTAQIAQFSTLEQQIASNEYLESLSQARDYSAQALAVSYIGQEALAPAGLEGVAAKVTTTQSGQSVDFAFTLNSNAFSNQVDIYNATGELMKTLEGDKRSGLNTMTWDGTDTKGDAVPPGAYTIQVKATAQDGAKVTHRLYTYEEVTAVASDGENIGLTLANDKVVDFTEVQQVRAPARTES